MNQRDSLLDQFSTFILWRSDRFQQWQTDPRLHRHMASHLANDKAITSSQYWVAYWHQQWQQSTSQPVELICRNHLYSYLQESCYRVALQLWNHHQDRDDHTPLDLFNQGILNCKKLLEKYNPAINPNLAAYASFFLKWRIIDDLRRQDKSYGHTMWSLLLHSSESRVRKALVDRGLTDTVLESHLQAWEIYVELYKLAKIKHDGKVQAPPTKIWTQIAAAYNSLMPQVQSSDQIKHWVETCGQAVFSSISPPTLSSNITVGSDGKTEIIDLISIELPDSEDDASPRNYQETHNQILAWMQVEWRDLDIKQYRLNENIRTIVQLYYGEGQEQTEISQKLGINQSTVSRNLNKVRSVLTDRFITWAADNLHMPLQSSDIETIDAAVNQWLWAICQTQSTKGEEG
jgi:RNA polymerase sigma factor (sigma-70 family)